MKKKHKDSKYKRLLVKEIVFSALAVVSVSLLLWEFFDSPTQQQQKTIFRIDIVIAVIFLIDYIYMFYKAKHKKHFVIHNWYLLLASIPIVESWAEILKGLRLLVLVRLLRAGEHVLYARELYTQAEKPAKRSPHIK